MRYALVCGLLLCSTALFGAYGDTTRVRTHNKVLIQTEPSVGHTNYPAWGVFPAAGKSYRKVYAELTFQCPTGMNCGEWDYLNYIFIGKRHNGSQRDTLDWEIMRFITPYGNQFNQQWKHTWKFDITDFASLFHDSIEISYQHTGYEAKNGRGWLITIDFTMIEGSEARKVLNIAPILRRSVGYGNDSLFDAGLPEYKFKVGNNTKTVRYKILQTGHGMDGKDGCGEFCAKKRYVVFDGKTIDTTLVWRDDCGSNPVFPQAGTWIYDRAAWCPGAEVREYNLDIPLAPGSEHVLDMDMESYQGGGNYMITQYLIEYGDHVNQIDASLEEIIRPNDELRYQRLNPSCGTPLITIKNDGKNVLHSVWLEYGWKGYKMERFLWKGDLPSDATTPVELPALQSYANVGTAFVVHILSANNQRDGNEENNTIQSIPVARPVEHIRDLIIVILTNNAASENYYTLTKSDGTVISKKGNFANKTVYRDTVHLSDGCYLLNLMDDGPAPAQYPINKDGLGWWANTYDENGLFQLRNAANNAAIKYFQADFGTGIWYQFIVGNLPAPANPEPKLLVYPNPVENDLIIDLGMNSSETLRIELWNPTGKRILESTRSGALDALQFLSLTDVPSGVYFVKVQHGNQHITQKIIRR